MSDDADRWGPGWVQPLTATPVSPAGWDAMRIIETAAPLFGLPGLWGWQRHAIALLSTPGMLTVVIIICRQTGKTALLALIILSRLVCGQRVAYTMHQRALAAEKWEAAAAAIAAAAGDRVKVVRSKGAEQIRDLVSGGACKLTTPDDAGGRSDTYDTLIVDEASHIHPAYLRAARGSTITRPHAQTILISSGMTDSSEDLADARDAAYGQLAAADSARTHGVLEWAAKSEPGHRGVDVLDEAVWHACIPTLGLPGGVSLDVLRAIASDTDAETFAREYLSIPSGSPISPPITSSMWARVQTPPPIDHRDLRNRVVAVETNPLQSRSSVVLAGAHHVTGAIHVALLANGAGDDWLTADAVAACRRTEPLDVIVDARSPAAHIADGLAMAGWEPTLTGAAHMATSSAAFYSAVAAAEPDIRIVADDALSAAALSAVRRQIADVGWAWHRRDGTDLDITPLVAASLAHRGVQAYPPPAPPPVL